MEPVVKTEDLTKTYQGRRGRKVEALKDLNLEVYPSEVFGLLGPNGAGKSTTIKLLMGLIRPTRGRLFIKGEPVRGDEYRRMIGYLPENPSFYDYLTAEEYLFFVGRVFGMQKKRIREEAGRLLQIMELEDASKRPIKGYSKGMVQRLGLAQALLHDPEILILDEPMSGLDPVGRIRVRELILQMKKKGKTIFMSTHILSDLELLCDRVGILVNGQLKALVNIDELMSEGIDRYTVKFKRLSEKLKETLVNAGATEVSDLRFSVPKEGLLTVLYLSEEDSQSQVTLIEPERKGLEELFREIINMPMGKENSGSEER